MWKPVLSAAKHVRHVVMPPNGLTAIDRDYDQKTTELNFNYVIRDFRARVMLFYLQKDFSAVQANDKQVGVGFQVQM